MIIPKSAFQKCFEDWKKHWHKFIISEGDYFEEDNIVFDEYLIFFEKNKNSPYFLNRSHVFMLF